MLDIDPTAEKLTELKTAVSEAVTNAIIHAYPEENGYVTMTCIRDGDIIEVIVSDEGCGIENIKKAMEPLYTSSPETERSGMGFTVMEAFTDGVVVESTVGGGTTVKMKKCMK